MPTYTPAGGDTVVLNDGQMSEVIVPAGVTGVTITVAGAGGGRIAGAGTQSKGASVTGHFEGLTPGETLYCYPGGAGQNTPGVTAFNGGGAGGNMTASGVNSIDGAGGGGASDVRRGGTALANRIIVGGGGGGNTGAGGAGGNGGYSTGANSAGGAGGGTQSAGGAAVGTGATAGTLGVGGNGGNATDFVNRGGGGGGGYYGGGAGGRSGPGGGGGSSYYDPAFTSVTAQASGSATNTGVGTVTLVFDEVNVIGQADFGSMDAVAEVVTSWSRPAFKSRRNIVWVRGLDGERVSAID